MPWELTGNASTNETVDVVGTTDSHALVIRTNNKEGLRVDAAGNVGLGTATPGEHLTVGGGTLADTKIEINAGGNQYAGLRIKNSQDSWIWQVVLPPIYRVAGCAWSMRRLAESGSRSLTMAMSGSGQRTPPSCLMLQAAQTQATGIWSVRAQQTPEPWVSATRMGLASSFGEAVPAIRVP